MQPVPNAEASTETHAPLPASAISTHDVAVTAVPTAQSYAPTGTQCGSLFASQRCHGVRPQQQHQTTEQQMS